MSNQEPLVKVGTVLSIGTVKSIENDCVRLVFKGNEFTASFTAVEKVFFEEK
jgi:hypothetical protein|tara:strand:+ start:657 stop:812 length:156 start_codon:yes stop_codon:yes gene_type:complete